MNSKIKDFVLVPLEVLYTWRLAWLSENDPQDGTDCITPFDDYLYGEANKDHLWYPDNDDWVEITPGDDKPDELDCHTIIDVMVNEDRESRSWNSYPEAASWWTWGKIIAYKVVR